MAKSLARVPVHLLPGVVGAALLAVGVGLFDYRFGLVVAGALLLLLDRRMP